MADLAERPSSGRFALAFAVLVSAVLAGSAMVTPAVMTALDAATGEAPWPFSRVFDRVAVVVLVLALVVLRRPLGLARVGEAWRTETWRGRVRKTALGLGLSLIPALLVLAPAIGESGLLWAGRTVWQAAWTALAAVPAAVLVAFLEELLYRVVVFRGVAATWHWSLAAVLSSAFYSAVHFLTPDRTFVVTGASPAAGLGYLGAVLGRLARWELLPALVGLFLIGLVLCVALHRSRSLALCAGLHAGWFLAVKVAILVTSLPPTHAGGGSAAKRELLLASPWVWCAVAVTAVAVVVLTRTGGTAPNTRSPRRSGPPAGAGSGSEKTDRPRRVETSGQNS